MIPQLVSVIPTKFLLFRDKTCIQKQHPLTVRSQLDRRDINILKGKIMNIHRQFVESLSLKVCLLPFYMTEIN